MICAFLLKNRYMSAMKTAAVQLKQTKSDGLGGQVQNALYSITLYFQIFCI